MGWHYQQKPPMGWPLDLDSGLADFVGAWFMQEGSGHKVFDLSGNGHVGTLTGTAPSWTPGKFGSAVLLPGTDEYINVSPFPTFTTDLTVSLWFKQNQYVASSMLIDAVYASGYALYFGSGKIYGYVNNSRPVSTTDFTTDIDWHHVVLTWDGVTIKLYIDSIQEGGDVPQGTIGAHTRLYIGYYSGSNYFNGIIDVPTLYNHALTAGEIAQLYREPFCMFKDPDEIPVFDQFYSVGNAGIMTLNTGYWGPTF